MPESIVRARVDAGLKAEATAVFNRLGLTSSEAIRLFLHCVADGQCLPFPVKLPNHDTQSAMHELSQGLCRTCCGSVETLFAELASDADPDAEPGQEGG